MVQTPTTSEKKVRKPSKLEGIKERSNFLREPVATELLQDTTHFTEEAIQILSFMVLINKITVIIESEDKRRTTA